MFMGGEIYLPGYEEAWEVGRELNLPIALHVVGTFGMQPTFDQFAKASGKFGPDCFFIDMTGMSEIGWKAAADAGAHVTIRRADRDAHAPWGYRSTSRRCSTSAIELRRFRPMSNAR